MKNADVEQFRRDVDALMKPAYGIDWQDACGDLDPLRQALESGDSPAAFVSWWARKYGLKRLDDPTFFDCDRCGTDCGQVYSDARTGEFLCEDCAPKDGVCHCGTHGPLNDRGECIDCAEAYDGRERT